MKFIRVIAGTGERIEQEVLECYLDDGLGLVDRNSLTYIVLGGGPEYRPVSFGPVTVSGLLITMASNSGGAGFRLPVGTAPTAPVTGDLWPTADGLFFRRSGETVNLTGAVTTWSGINALLPTRYEVGLLGADWTPNYANGPTQILNLGAARGVVAPVNMPDRKEALDFHAVCSGFALSFSSTYYSGPQLTFSGYLEVAGTIKNFGRAKFWVSAAGNV